MRNFATPYFVTGIDETETEEGRFFNLRVRGMDSSYSKIISSLPYENFKALPGEDDIIYVHSRPDGIVTKIQTAKDELLYSREI